MKVKYLFFSLCMLLLTSCFPNENTITYFNEETLVKEMKLSTMIEDLVELEVTSIKVIISGYNDWVTNSKIKLGNTILASSVKEKSISVSKLSMLENVSQEFFDKHNIPLLFSGYCNSADTFKVSISITFKGVFGA